MNTIAAFQCACLSGMLLFSTTLRAAPDLAAPIRALLREQGLVGAVWTTLDAQGAAGASDARSGKPMRTDQRVQVGSIAKTVLAVGILRLVSEQRLSLDTPVAHLLPGMAFDNPWQASDPLRIRHLLDHTSGLDDARFWQVFSMKPQADTPLAAAFPPGSGLLRIRHRPGARFSYSNMAYTLLGMVIETLTKQPYERYLDAHLLAPLGMHDSTFAFVTQDTDPRLAMGHFENGIPHPAVRSFVRPAGQFTTTAADMARLARFLMSDGSAQGRPFIAAALLRQMGKPHGTEAAQAGLQIGYGLGLETRDRNGALGKCHSGSTVGFRAMLCLYPDTQQAFFIALNADSETADHNGFDALFVNALGLARPLRGITLASPFDSSAWQGFYIPSPNRFESLRLVDTAFNVVRVSGEGNMLRLHPLQSAAVDLVHAGPSLFRAPGRTRASHVLLTSDEGARIISNGRQSFEQVSLMRLLPLWTSVAIGLSGLAFILVKGLTRLAARRWSRQDPLLAPFAAASALLLPLPFFYRQSLLQLGDLTLASGLLAIVTALLPAGMLIGLASSLKRNHLASIDAAAMLAVLQLSLLLAAWGLLPLRLWT